MILWFPACQKKVQYVQSFAKFQLIVPAALSLSFLENPSESKDFDKYVPIFRYKL